MCLFGSLLDITAHSTLLPHFHPLLTHHFYLILGPVIWLDHLLPNHIRKAIFPSRSSLLNYATIITNHQMLHSSPSSTLPPATRAQRGRAQ